MDVRIITTPADFAAIRPAWDALHERSCRRSVFLSHAWLDAAWQWRSPFARLHILCCRRGGELVGALPLIRDNAPAGRIAGRTLELLTVPDTQTCDVLAAADDAGSVAVAFAEQLIRQQPEWDALRLRYLSPEGIAATALAPVLAKRGARVDVRAASTNPRIALDAPWDAYYASRSRRLKKAANLAANRLAKAGTVNIEWLAPGQGDARDVGRALDAVIRISARSWKTRTGNSLDQPGPQAFVRCLTKHAHDRGWLSIWTLSLDGLPIAMEYQLIGDGNVYALRSDFDASYESLSPGSHLSRRMLETLFGQGLRYYLMGPGENPYKYRWTDETEPVVSMTVYGRSLRGRALAAWELALKPAARRLRDRIRPPAVAGADETQEADDDERRSMQ